MKNQFNINIKTPCSENFNQFKKTTNGGFCGSCEMEVIDFTKMKSDEIINYFKNNTSNSTCGRFNIRQLSSNTHKKNNLNFLSRLSLACISLFSIFSIQAQDTKKNTELINQNTLEIKSLKAQNKYSIKGTVTENNLPLPGVNIVLQGTEIGIATDFDGNFEFPIQLKKGDVLVFSYLGMSPQKIIISDQNSAKNVVLNVDMTMDNCFIMGKVAVKGIYKSKKD